MSLLRRSLIACVCAFFALQHSHAADVATSSTASTSIQAAFAPWDDIEDLVVTTIQTAKEQVLVQAYLLTSQKIIDALISTRQRGLDVRVLLDAEQTSGPSSSRIAEMVAAGIPVWIETKYQHAHNKIILVDAKLNTAAVITGSYNFTWSAQHRNAENILIVRQNPALASEYAFNWERHQRDAVPYKK